jgi:hypothetical protein
MGKSWGLILIGLAVVGAGAYFILRPTYPTTLSFEDSSGTAHSFAEYKQQAVPVLLTLVMEGDSYSPRTAALMAKLRGEVPEEQLAMLAFYFTASDPKVAEAYATAHGLTFPVIPVKKTPGLDVDLLQTLGVKYGGDVALVDIHGKIKKLIVCKDLTAEEFEGKVRAAVATVAR